MKETTCIRYVEQNGMQELIIESLTETEDHSYLTNLHRQILLREGTNSCSLSAAKILGMFREFQKLPPSCTATSLGVRVKKITGPILFEFLIVSLCCYY